MSLKLIIKKNRLVRNICEKPYRLSRRIAGVAHHFKNNTRWASDYPVVRLSPFGQHFFFGYYDKNPWNKDQDLLLGLNTNFAGRPPQKNEPAKVVILKCNSPEAPICISKTTAWCWQQGNMLQWIPYQSSEAILFNHYHHGTCSTAIFSKEGNSLLKWPFPTFAISKDGRKAIELDFGRLNYCAPGYGYCAENFQNQKDPCPDNSGLFIWDTNTQKKQLTLSIKHATQYQPRKDFQNSYHYFAHADFNPSGTRLAFFHRWRRKNATEKTRFFTIDVERGYESLHLLADHDMTSHYTWTDDQTLIAWANHQLGTKYYQFDDLPEKDPKPLGDGMLDQDGHPSLSPNGRWMVTDTYPDEYCQRHLLLFDLKKHELHHIGRFLNPLKHWGSCRCDLHPRWSRCGSYLCIDSVHEGFRGIYSVNVSSLTNKN